MKDDVLQNLEIVRIQEQGTDRPDKHPVQDPYGTDDPDVFDVRAASVTDCTGLIPAGTDSQDVLESYAEVYHYPADAFHG